MRAAVITIAGISSRFNEGKPEKDKRHKIIYYDGEKKNTLLYHLVEKCMYADKIILVGGNKYEDVQKYCTELPEQIKSKIILVYNEHYADLSSGYSLYIGLNELFSRNEYVDEVLFVEGDLDIDKESFDNVVNYESDVLTYSYEPIYANKSVVLYKNQFNKFKYAFNSNHGLLKIDEAFSLILNSGQLWKFKDIEKLKKAIVNFYKGERVGTNLFIIQSYIDLKDSNDFELIGLKRWTNCNTREDYKKILKYWKEEDQ